MNRNRVAIHAAIATAVLIGAAGTTHARHDRILESAAKLEQAVYRLEHGIAEHFYAVPAYPEFMLRAASLRDRTLEVNALIASGVPASTIYPIADGIKRDADRLERDLGRVKYKDYHIPKDCRKQVVRWADDVEDTSARLRSDLRKLKHEPVVFVGHSHPRRHAVPHVPRVPQYRQPVHHGRPTFAPPAPNVNRSHRGPAFRHEVRREPNRRHDGRFESRAIHDRQDESHRQLRIGPLRISF